MRTCVGLRVHGNVCWLNTWTKTAWYARKQKTLLGNDVLGKYASTFNTCPAHVQERKVHRVVQYWAHGSHSDEKSYPATGILRNKATINISWESIGAIVLIPLIFKSYKTRRTRR